MMGLHFLRVNLLQAYHLVARRVRLDLRKQPGKQFVAGAPQKIRTADPALLQILLRHEKLLEGLRMTVEQFGTRQTGAAYLPLQPIHLVMDLFLGMLQRLE